MAIKIEATRKVNLKDFAEGWDTCFIRVRTVSEEKRLEIGALLEGIDATNIDNINKLRTAVAEVVTDGRVMSTDDEGKQRAVNFNANNTEDLEAVLGALNTHWLQEMLLTSVGLQGLNRA